MKSYASKQNKLKKISLDSNSKLKIQLGKPSKKILKFESSPSQTLLDRLPSPKNAKLKPIQTLTNLSKPSKSNETSPQKHLYTRSLIISPKANSIKLEIPIIKQSKRRTQSMNSDIIQNNVPYSANFITRCIYKTRVGSMYGKNKKDNQDSFIIHNKLLGNLSNYLFSVCDGHGLNGHLVSRHLKHTFPSAFEHFLSQYRNTDNYISKSYSSAIKTCESQLIGSDIDIQYSGSTMVSVIIFSNYLICANIGDSRAVIGKKEESWVAEELSRDHKPELNDEALRIKKTNGRIMSFIGPGGVPVGPKRVWLHDKDAPGLAMSRSIGDLVASSVGVISEPEFKTRVIGKDDAFIVIASDGLWEFMSSNEVVQIIGRMLDNNKSQFICDELVTQAVRKWSKLDGVVDDITILVIFLNAN